MYHAIFENGRERNDFMLLTRPRPIITMTDGISKICLGMIQCDAITKETTTVESPVLLDQQRGCYMYQCILLWICMDQ
jgi:hypothetical protein